MGKFVVEGTGRDGLFPFFEDDGETGYFYLYEPGGDGIIDHLHIYSISKQLRLRKEDVEVVWSNDSMKCGVKIWGYFYGVFDIFSSHKLSKSITSRGTQPITNKRLINGFG